MLNSSLGASRSRRRVYLTRERPPDPRWRRQTVALVLVAEHTRSARPIGTHGLTHCNVMRRSVGDRSELHTSFRAVEFGTQDDVDDAADGIGAVDGGRTVRDYFYTLDRGQRDHGDIDKASVAIAGRHTMTIDQNERCTGA